MKSGIRPADAVTLFTIFKNPGKGGDQLVAVFNILAKCLGSSSDAGAGRGGHNGGNVYMKTVNTPKPVQLFSYSTKSFTSEKVAEALAALTPLVADLPDENLRRVVNFVNTPGTAAVGTADFIEKT